MSLDLTLKSIPMNAAPPAECYCIYFKFQGISGMTLSDEGTHALVSKADKRATDFYKSVTLN